MIGRSVNFVEVMREPIMIYHMMIILNLPYFFSMMVTIGILIFMMIYH